MTVDRVNTFLSKFDAEDGRFLCVTVGQGVFAQRWVRNRTLVSYTFHPKSLQ